MGSRRCAQPVTRSSARRSAAISRDRRSRSVCCDAGSFVADHRFSLDFKRASLMRRSSSARVCTDSSLNDTSKCQARWCDDSATRLAMRASLAHFILSTSASRTSTGSFAAILEDPPPIVDNKRVGMNKAAWVS